MLHTDCKKKEDRKIAYFTMEIGLSNNIPTYSGGLGILAGDTIKTFADLKVPVICMTLLNRQGYFKQHINDNCMQEELAVEWDPQTDLTKLETTVQIQIEKRTVTIGVWEYLVKGESAGTLPVYFLDTDLPENTDYDRALCGHLYAGDRKYRFCQEMILGIGGARMIEALQYTGIEKFHLNEGHAALATVELLNNTNDDIEHVKEHCVFTTHTPVAAGHDTFDIKLAGQLIGDFYPWETKLAEHDGKFNMTYLALNLSNYINGVAKKHQEVSMHMFPGREIHSITNGIHTQTWTGKELAAVFDEHIPDWRHDPFSLRAALSIPQKQIWDAHQKAKGRLLDRINKEHNAEFEEDVLTIGFARRATAYKRADLVFTDINWLKAIAQRAGKIQFVFAGKAHVQDTQGKELIQKICHLRLELGDKIKLVWLENYEMELGKLITNGVDIWLNTPMRPLEASGTSGMKAAVNGVPNFSVLDGWWIEGHIEDRTGWSIGPLPKGLDYDDSTVDAKDLYDKLEHKILPMYYKRKEDWIHVMKHSIALNGSFFHTHRMAQQYVTNAYF
ncbi:MAG: starch phosphorylase [Candidatus Woesearchaeota archaeon]|jgi:starch phosphorylase